MNDNIDKTNTEKLTEEALKKISKTPAPITSTTITQYGDHNQVIQVGECKNGVDEIKILKEEIKLLKQLLKEKENEISALKK